MLLIPGRHGPVLSLAMQLFLPVLPACLLRGSRGGQCLKLPLLRDFALSPLLWQRGPLRRFDAGQGQAVLLASSGSSWIGLS